MLREDLARGAIGDKPGSCLWRGRTTGTQQARGNDQKGHGADRRRETHHGGDPTSGVPADEAPRVAGCKPHGVTNTAALDGALPADPGPGGLSGADAERRRGQVRRPPRGRTYAGIVRANVLTLFNVILAAFATLTLVFGDWRDGFFLVILVVNTAIGITQEVRAKRAVDRLAALVAPTARVMRDGAERRVPINHVVPGDLVLLGTGDQVPAAGVLRSSQGLELDESVLTGESRPAVRNAGDPVRAGAFCVEGAGTFVAAAVGADSYAGRLAGTARAFRHPLSPLQRGMNRLQVAMLALMIPLAAVLALALWHRHVDAGETVSTATAAVVTLFPEGLILLASVTYAVAALRMTRRGALSQQLAAVESLASVDVVLLDKTGTLTTGNARVVAREPVPHSDPAALDAALGTFAAAWADQDETIAAIALAVPGVRHDPDEVVHFSSRRRWSGIRVAGETLVLGAPGVINAGPLADEVARETEAGRRVLVLARGDMPLGTPGAGDGPPDGLEPIGIVALSETLQPDVREAVTFLANEGVAVHVVSGDAPSTVGAIARDCGVRAQAPVLASTLPDDPVELAAAVAHAGVIGRATPDDKERIVRALTAQGQNVAMFGDGVNDVPALKAARVAIAPGSATEMARAVADIVLVRGGFGSIAPMVGEGRRALRNLQRVSNLFVTKSFLAAFLILTVGLIPTSYPFLPRHLTLLSTLTIGIPALFLALAPSTGPWRLKEFVTTTFQFALPAGIAAGLGVTSSYLFATNVAGADVMTAQTIAVTALMTIGLWLVIVLEIAGVKRSAWVILLCLAMGGAYAAVIVVAPLRDFFALALISPVDIAIALSGAAITATGLWILDRRFRPEPIRGPLPRWLARFIPESMRAGD